MKVTLILTLIYLSLPLKSFSQIFLGESPGYILKEVKSNYPQLKYEETSTSNSGEQYILYTDDEGGYIAYYFTKGVCLEIRKGTDKSHAADVLAILNTSFINIGAMKWVNKDGDISIEVKFSNNRIVVRYTSIE